MIGPQQEPLDMDDRTQPPLCAKCKGQGCDACGWTGFATPHRGTYEERELSKIIHALRATNTRLLALLRECDGWLVPMSDEIADEVSLHALRKRIAEQLASHDDSKETP